MPPLAIAALISAGTAAVKGIAGGIQASRGNRGFNKTMANRPDYEIPSEYQDILARYQQAGASNMPGYDQQLSQIGQAGARARGSAERGAISSTAYGSQVGSIYQKELDAIQNLGVQQEQYKTVMLDKGAGAEGVLASQKGDQWNQNENLKWQQKRNELTGISQAEQTNDANAWLAFQNSIADYAGTKYYTDALKGLQNSGVAGTVNNGFQSNPLGGYNPQDNLNKTLKSQLGNIKINYPR